VALAAGLALGVLALLIARPWVDRPFDVIDFSEFLPTLTGSADVFHRFTALTRYYAGEHGRLNILSYFALAAKWSILGPSPVLWQWCRVVELGLVTGGVFLLFRRLTLGPVAALAGASLFVVAQSATEAWVRMTMGEPLGLLCALGALLIATRWRQATRPVPLYWASGFLILLAILAKEMLVGLLPLVWGIGLASPSGTSARSWAGRRTALRAVVMSSALPALGLVAVAGAALGHRSAGFTAMYGADAIASEAVLTLLLRPFHIQGGLGGIATWLAPGQLLFMGVVAGGTFLGRREPETGLRLREAWVAALLLAVMFMVLYLPWPYAFLYYGMPFLLGPAFLFATAFETLSRSKAVVRRLAFAAWSGLLLTAGAAAGRGDARTIALQQVNGELAMTLARIPNADRIVVARGQVAASPAMGTATMLRRYALATSTVAELPPAEDLRCADAGTLIRDGLARTVLISYHLGCGRIVPATATFVRHYTFARFGWEGLGLGTDSLGADLIAEPTVMTAPRAVR
jgi:hypothetical protein